MELNPVDIAMLDSTAEMNSIFCYGNRIIFIVTLEIKGMKEIKSRFVIKG